MMRGNRLRPRTLLHCVHCMCGGRHRPGVLDNVNSAGTNKHITWPQSIHNKVATGRCDTCIMMDINKQHIGICTILILSFILLMKWRQSEFKQITINILTRPLASVAFKSSTEMPSVTMCCSTFLISSSSWLRDARNSVVINGIDFGTFATVNRWCFSYDGDAVLYIFDGFLKL